MSRVSRVVTIAVLSERFETKGLQVDAGITLRLEWPNGTHTKLGGGNVLCVMGYVPGRPCVLTQPPVGSTSSA